MPNTNRRIAGVVSLAAAVFLVCAAMFVTGCASSKADEFRHRLGKMSDADLVAYYNGINQRAGDLHHDIRQEEHMNQPHPRHNIYPTPFAIGGGG